jgi:hypothetical protein
MPWLLAIQIVLLVLWYTALPMLPVWLVWLPMMIFGVALAVWLLIFGGLLTLFAWVSK